MIVDLDPAIVDADLLYELEQLLECKQSQQLAERVEIERRHVVSFAGREYRPTFTRDELVTIGLCLLDLKQHESDVGRVESNVVRGFSEAVFESLVECAQDEECRSVAIAGTVGLYGVLSDQPDARLEGRNVRNN